MAAAYREERINNTDRYKSEGAFKFASYGFVTEETKAATHLPRGSLPLVSSERSVFHPNWAGGGYSTGVSTI